MDGQKQTKILLRGGYKEKQRKKRKGKEENVRNVKIAHTSAFSLRKLVDSPRMDLLLFRQAWKIFHLVLGFEVF